MLTDYDVIVLGGGAAGLMCAITAGHRNRRVVVLERSNRIGKKILMSGGGRCNFTNLFCEPGHFLSANPGFCVSALRRYTPSDFIALVEMHDIAYHEKAAGQLFCDHSSKDIVRMLATQCQQAGVRIETDFDITRVAAAADGYAVTADKGRFTASSLVVATGGLSIPKMGASDFGYRLARQFGLRVHETRAGLVPFTFSGAIQQLTGRLSGVSLPAALSSAGVIFSDDVLFTHRGLSGPAALQLSSYWAPCDEIQLDLLPSLDVEKWLLEAKTTQPKIVLRTLLSEVLPRALVLELQRLMWPDFADQRLAEVPNTALRIIAAKLRAWQLLPAGTEGYRTAEVTMGGVDTRQLSSKTMECRPHRGLYFIGEVVDVTGHLGGFNFQWAWSSGQAAGLVV